MDNHHVVVRCVCVCGVSYKQKNYNIPFSFLSHEIGKQLTRKGSVSPRGPDVFKKILHKRGDLVRKTNKLVRPSNFSFPHTILLKNESQLHIFNNKKCS